MKKEKIAAVCVFWILVIAAIRYQDNQQYKVEWARFTLAQPNWEKMDEAQRARAFDYFVKHDKEKIGEDKGFKSEVMRRLYPKAYERDVW